LFSLQNVPEFLLIYNINHITISNFLFFIDCINERLDSCVIIYLEFQFQADFYELNGHITHSVIDFNFQIRCLTTLKISQRSWNFQKWELIFIKMTSYTPLFKQKQTLTYYEVLFNPDRFNCMNYRDITKLNLFLIWSVIFILGIVFRYAVKEKFTPTLKFGRSIKRLVARKPERGMEKGIDRYLTNGSLFFIWQYILLRFGLLENEYLFKECLFHSMKGLMASLPLAYNICFQSGCNPF
jgi:hypothetical protein